MTRSQEFVFGYHAINGLLNHQHGRIIRLYLSEQRDDPRIQKVKQLAENRRIKIELRSLKQLNEQFPNEVHQGMVAICTPATQYHESDLEKLVTPVTDSTLVLLLDGVQDPQNLGACIRSANAFGAQAVIIPKNRAAQLTPVVAKVASGALFATPLISVTNMTRCLNDLQQMGIWSVGCVMETTVSIFEVDLKRPLALIMGGEQLGIKHLLRKNCDYLAKIPMSGTVESLNVSAATAIALYEVKRQRVTKLNVSEIE